MRLLAKDSPPRRFLYRLSKRRIAGWPLRKARQIQKDFAIWQRARSADARAHDGRQRDELARFAASLDRHDQTRPQAEAPLVMPARGGKPRVMIPFSDDSTLIFAGKMRDCLLDAAPTTSVTLALLQDENALSDRQMTALLPEGPDVRLTRLQFKSLILDEDFDAIVASRMFAPLGSVLKEYARTPPANRPAIIGCLGGLEFFPDEAWHRRRNCDGVFLFPKASSDRFQQMADRPAHQQIGFGHPAFVQPKNAIPDDLPSGDICFFTQALSPVTRSGRQHMLNVMAAIARANPDRRVRLKLRHLPDENRRHKHKERFDFPSLFAAMENMPGNLELTACTMEEAMATTALGITCTSTAAIDLIREGIPTMVHLDYVGNYTDPLVQPMRALFDKSGLIAPLEDVLRLKHRPPEAAWLSDMFCPAGFGQAVLDMIAALKRG